MKTTQRSKLYFKYKLTGLGGVILSYLRHSIDKNYTTSMVSFAEIALNLHTLSFYSVIITPHITFSNLLSFICFLFNYQNVWSFVSLFFFIIKTEFEHKSKMFTFRSE